MQNNSLYEKTEKFNLFMFFLFVVAVMVHLQAILLVMIGVFIGKGYLVYHQFVVEKGMMLLPAISIVAATFYSGVKEFRIGLRSKTFVFNVSVVIVVILVGLAFFVVDVLHTFNVLADVQTVILELVSWAVLLFSILYASIMEWLIIYLKMD